MIDFTFENLLYLFFIVLMTFVIKGALEDFIMLIAKIIEKRNK